MKRLVDGCFVTIIIFCLLIFAAAYGIVGGISGFQEPEITTFIVTELDHEVKRTSGGIERHTYRIWTDQGRFNNYASDHNSKTEDDVREIFAQLEVGNTYEAEVVGFRINNIGIVPNIISIGYPGELNP